MLIYSHWVFVLEYLNDLARIPEGMGMFLCTQGMCSTTRILTGEKYSSLNHPFSASVHANPSSLTLRIWWRSLSSSGQRKLCSLRATSAKINISYSILFNLTTSYSFYFGGKKGISRNKTSFFLLMKFVKSFLQEALTRREVRWCVGSARSERRGSTGMQ